MSVKPEQFDEFFEAVYGVTPFPWQTRLAAQVTNADGGVWPECLALPTGAGKTTCLDVALFSLACQAGRPAGERTAPRRIIFVVDRRVIVDEAFDHAVGLAKRLAQASGGVLKNMADALRTIAGHDKFAEVNPTLFEKGLPLTCHQLRGGMYRDDAWARTPSQPCVIASTVDQVGSRLLFRGYGQSSRSWSKSAGLAGNDSLIILDEAHCANPYLQTMRAIARFRDDDWAERPLGAPFHFAIMSATPPAGIAKDRVFREDAADRDHEVLGKRLSTSKPTTLVECKKASGKNWQTELAIELVSQALELVSEQRLAVAILVNRVATAKLVNQLLALLRDPDVDVADTPFRSKSTDVKKLRKRSGDVFEPWQETGIFDHELMTGRMRSFDKDAVTQNWLSRLKADPTRDKNASPILDLDRPVFIIATQCLEVGANLDFDGMVSECASLDALRQRFGRLNRIGRWDTADGVIVVRGDQSSPKNEDPVYGDKLARTWLWLNENTTTDDDAEQVPTIDFGISAMAARLNEMTPDDLRHYVLQGADAPVMLPAHVDLWSQTSPEPRPSPDVALFLHGPDSASADVQVCWRADVEREFLPAGRDYETAFRKTVALCPPTSAECLPVPIALFRRWLGTPVKDSVVDELLADTDAAIVDDADRIADKRERMLVWRGAGKVDKDSDDEPGTRLIRRLNDVKPGDTVVIPASLGGWSEFGHLPNGQPVDVGDDCQFAARRRPVLRLCSSEPLTTGSCRSLLSEYGINLQHDESEPLREAFAASDEAGGLGAIDKRQWLEIIEGLSPSFRSDRSFGEIADALVSRPQQVTIEPHPFGGLILRGPRLPFPPGIDDLERRITMGESQTHEDDTASESPMPIDLNDHLQGVAAHAERFAEFCGLPPDLVASVKLAGELHDLGKADKRFQAMLHGGHHLRAKLFNRLLAKSQGLPITPFERKTAASRSELPSGFRHELLSLQIAEQTEDLLGNGDIDRDLVLHLIAAHHGYAGRPFAPVVVDPHVERGTHPEVDDLLDVDVTPVASNAPLKFTADDRRHWTPPHHLSSGIADRYWRLVRRYGWWGLAWLESLLITADHRQSEYEEALTAEEIAELQTAEVSE